MTYLSLLKEDDLPVCCEGDGTYLGSKAKNMSSCDAKVVQTETHRIIGEALGLRLR